jgi:glycolate oxidase iron-sulfur subunit
MPDLTTDKLVADELIRCNKCGFCLQNCPTYRATRMEGFVARGRNTYVKDILEGTLELDEALRDPLFECLLCGACTTSCLTRVKTDEIMVRAREAWHEKHGQPAIQRFIFNDLLPYPDRMTRIMRLLSLGKRTGMADLAQRLGVLRWINARLEGAAGLVETMPKAFLRDRLARIGFQRKHDPETGDVWTLARNPEAKPGPRVLCFIGCGTNYQLPRTGEAAMRLLSLGGCEVIVAANACCGLPAYAYGDRESARKLARQNLDLFAKLDFDVIATDCGSCSSFIKKYPVLLDDSTYSTQATCIAERAKDFSEVMVGLDFPKAQSKGLVTYHDPCHVVRGQGLADEPRKLLKDIAGVELREMLEANWCCGGAGSYNFMHPELSLQILDRKMGHIAETEAPVVATSCPSCIIQLAYGARTHNMPVRVKHVAEVMAESLGIELGE